MTRRFKNFGFAVPTSKEDREIAVGIAADADTFEVPSEEIARMRPRGRPRVGRPKAALTMRVDADVLDALKASGPGWQTRVNDLLKDVVRRGRV